MSNEKFPFKLSWYLDTRYNLYDKIYKKSSFSAMTFNEVYKEDRSNRHTLYIKVYSVFEKKPKLYKQDEMSIKTWEDIQNVNSLKGIKAGRELLLRQRRANLDAVMQKFQSHNKPGIYTRQQFDNSLKENIQEVTAADSYLYRLWAGCYFDKQNSSSHESASMKSFTSYIAMERSKGKEPLNFLIQDIDKRFIVGYMLWYTSREKANSMNTAISYLTDLQTVINYAIQKGVLTKQQNPFGKGPGKYQIPKKTSRAKQYTLNTAQLKSIMETMPENKDEQKAKDIFVLGFLFSGLRIDDIICLKKSSIKESMGEKYFETVPRKTDATNKTSEIVITPEIQKIIDKYPGEGKYVLDCIPDSTPKLEEQRIAKNYYRALVNHLKTFSERIKGVPSLSWSFNRFSVNHFLFVNNYASRDQIAELLVHAPKVDEQYFFDVDNAKFDIQKKLSNVISEEKPKKSLGKKDKKKGKKQATN